MKDMQNELKAALIIVAIIGLVALAALLIIPVFIPGGNIQPVVENVAPPELAGSPAPVTTENSARITAAALISTPPPTVPSPATIKTTPPVTAAASPSSTITPTPAITKAIATEARTNASMPAALKATPLVTQQPYSLPAGFGPSEGARSCPNPLPVDAIRKDFMAYWQAFEQAYRENNPSILKPFVDTQARDGKEWQDRQLAIQKTTDAGYFLDFQIEHGDTLVIKVNPQYGGPGQCQVSVFDGLKLTSVARKKGTLEILNKDQQPLVRQYRPSHSFEMNRKEGRWVMAGEGAGSL